MRARCAPVRARVSDPRNFGKFGARGRARRLLIRGMTGAAAKHDDRMGLLERSLELSGQVLLSCDAQLRVTRSYGECGALIADGALAPPLAAAVRAWRARGRRLAPLTTVASRDFRLVQIDEASGDTLIWLRRVHLGRATFGKLLRERYGFKLRSQQLLLLLTQGFGNREIAEQLGLRETTVKTYLHEVYETLGVRSRTAALAELRRTLYAEP